MTFHKEGYSTLMIVFIAVVIINFSVFYFTTNIIVDIIIFFATAFFAVFIIQFFRDPQRKVVIQEDKILSPADGKIVVIEEVEEPEYFKDKRIQVSIFMSPRNVHINFFPFSGIVKYYKYHKGKYLVAWDPKSSTENERSTIVLSKETSGTEILIRQIAGSVARRVVTYPRKGDKGKQGDQLGFIKFGSRVDLFLPLGTKINVEMEQAVIGTQTVIADMK